MVGFPWGKNRRSERFVRNSRSYASICLDLIFLYRQILVACREGAPNQTLEGMAIEVERLTELRNEYFSSPELLPDYEQHWTHPRRRWPWARFGSKEARDGKAGIWPHPLPSRDVLGEILDKQIDTEDSLRFRDRLWTPARFGPLGESPAGWVDEEGLIWLDQDRVGRISSDGWVLAESSSENTSHEKLIGKVKPNGKIREIVYPEGIAASDEGFWVPSPWDRTAGRVLSDGTLEGRVPRTWLRDRKIVVADFENGSLGAAAAWLLVHPSSACLKSPSLL